MEKLQVAVIGLGYFSQFHVRSWQKIEEAELIGIADRSAALVESWSAETGVPGFQDVASLMEETDPDIVDLVIPPVAHADVLRACFRAGRTIICQKPFCRSLEEAVQVTEEAAASGTTLLIHENFRFQPWYRDLKSLLDGGALGQIYQCRFALRPGDGQGPDAYLSRQPAFQKMERFLVHETAVHFLDLFRWLFGPVGNLYADLRQLNPAIAGEDAGTLLLTHVNGIRSVFDGNRLSDHVADNPRMTMGEMLVEGEKGAVRLDGFGCLWLRKFGEQPERQVPLTHSVDAEEFGGGCVEALNRHVVAALAGRGELENTAEDYLEVIRLDEASYASAETGSRIELYR